SKYNNNEKNYFLTFLKYQTLFFICLYYIVNIIIKKLFESFFNFFFLIEINFISFYYNFLLLNIFIINNKIFNNKKLKEIKFINILIFLIFLIFAYLIVYYIIILFLYFFFNII